MIVPLLYMCYILSVSPVSNRRSSVPAPSKRDKQNIKRGAQNKGLRNRLRNLSKSFYRAVESGDEEKARQIRDESQREYNKAASKGVVHQNRAARKVSRLDKALATDRNE